MLSGIISFLTLAGQPGRQRFQETARLGRNALRQTDTIFLQSDEARRIGDQVLLWQRNTGDWPKNNHDSQFYVVNCHLSGNILDADIDHVYKAQPALSAGKTVDPCPWGHRTYYYGCVREGGHSGWLNNNLSQAPGSPSHVGINATWTFDGRWDPEARIRSFWNVLAY